MGNTKAQRLQREKFITEHYEKIKEFITEFGAKHNGRELPGKVLNWINHTVRPALEYSDKTDPLQIWFTMRRDFERVGKQLEHLNHSGPLTFAQKVIALAVFTAIKNDQYLHFLGIRTGKTFLFTYLDRYLSSHPKTLDLEDFEQFIHKNPPHATKAT